MSCTAIRLGFVLVLTLAACEASPGEEASQAPSAGPSVAASPRALGEPTLPDVATVAAYRGSALRNGQMPGPGPADSPALAWQADTGAPAEATVLVRRGVVYLASSDGVVHAWDLGTGAERWSVDMQAPVAAPIVLAGPDLGLLVVADEAGTVTAIVEDGIPAWETTVTGGVSGSPALVDDGLLVATQLGRAYLLDPASGEERWRVELGAGVTRSIASTDYLAYLGLNGGDLVALSVANGSEVWRHEAGAAGAISSPAIGDGMVYFATGLESDNPADHGLRAVDAATGEMRWTYTSPSGARLYSPAVADGVAYVVGFDEHLVALDATTGEQMWSIDLGSVVEALPSVVDGVVYTASNDGSALAIDAETGEILWEVPITGVPWGPAVTGGYMLTGSSAGILYAIGGPD
jgi:outer membrane protein assembly factor BamB